MKLYTFEFAPNPQRLHLFMKLKGIEIPSQEINLGEPQEQFSPDFKSINPSCTVPCLVLDDGQILSEVIGICSYLEDLYPDRALMGNDSLERAQVISWDHRIYLEGMSPVAEILRNGNKAFAGRAMPGALAVEQIPELIDRGVKRLDAFFDIADAALEAREFLVGSGPSLADIDLFVLVNFAGWTKTSIPEHCTRLASHHKRMAVLLG
ncbi:MAG: glutathione S-transferase family protein [Pseudomonadales bacterium]